MAETQSWTIAEAAFVLGEPLDAFKRIVDRGPVRPQLEWRGRLRIRAFRLQDLIFLRAAKELQEELTPKARTELYEAILTAPRHSREPVAFGRLKVEVGGFRRDVETRLKELEALLREIDASADGEARIRGTAIEAHRIAALLDGGMTVDAILTDYPSLTKRQVLAARAFADAHPKPGRPYPKTTAKAAVRGAGLDVLDEVMGVSEAAE